MQDKTTLSESIANSSMPPCSPAPCIVLKLPKNSKEPSERAQKLLMYVGVVELLRNLPLYGGGFVSPLIRDS